MLSTTAEYALRAMVQLSRAGVGQPVLGRDLAERARVPSNYLAKILLELKKAGLVNTARGSRGGYRLTRDADSILLVRIVEIFDASRANPRCLLDISRDCSDEEACTAHEKWKAVRSTYLDFLETTSLADVSTTRNDRAGPDGGSPQAGKKPKG